MTEKEKILTSNEPTLLGYIGAALLGLVLNMVAMSVMSGNSLYGIITYAVYILVVTIIDFKCVKDNCRWACRFNEFSITLTELVMKKLNIKDN